MANILLRKGKNPRTDHDSNNYESSFIEEGVKIDKENLNRVQSRRFIWWLLSFGRITFPTSVFHLHKKLHSRK